MAARMNKSADRTAELRNKELPDFSLSPKQKSPKQKSPLRQVKEEMQIQEEKQRAARIKENAEKARKSKLGASYTKYSELYAQSSSPPKKTTRYDGSHPSELLDKTKDKFARRAAVMESPSKSSPVAASPSPKPSPDKSRETRKPEAPPGSGTESQGGGATSEDAIWNRYDAVSKRDTVPKTQSPQTGLRESRQERLLSRATVNDEAEASATTVTTMSGPSAQQREEVTQPGKREAVSGGQSILMLVMISLLPLLLFGCYKVVAQNIDPAQAQQLEAFVSGAEAQVAAWFEDAAGHLRNLAEQIGFVEAPKPKPAADGFFRL